MALYDHRVFDWEGEWWAAQVHGGSGAGWSSTPAITRETVIFTSLSDRDRASKAITIPAGLLSKLGHQALGRVLEAADPWESRFDMSGYNAPDAADFPDQYQFEDEDGLNWGARRHRSVVIGPSGPELKDSIELVCLDDSGLRGEVPFASSSTLGDFLSTHGKPGLAELARFIKARMENDYDPHDDKY